ncbi:hypothetical protein AAFF_G00339280 [Aldrovandia affinis]|uniref:Uncharacterized protein n=1 Tax=Aldrovandia affinis TaxID=143900 RepID=A0AAD7SKQ2_9TELE|nr:hypothetical protein AAFF_G00339280 [Aldrovandia affinis]
MDQFFVNLGSTSQSTPKPKDNSTSQDHNAGPDPDLDATAERSTFGSLDGSYEQQVSDDSGIGGLRSEPDGDLRSEDSAYFSGLGTRVDEIGRRAQHLVETINVSRATDQEIMDDFQERLNKKVNEVCQQVREQVFSGYEINNHLMESRLRELSEVLGRSSQLIAELQAASRTLAAINKGLCKTPKQ